MTEFVTVLKMAIRCTVIYFSFFCFFLFLSEELAMAFSIACHPFLVCGHRFRDSRHTVRDNRPTVSKPVYVGHLRKKYFCETSDKNLERHTT